MVSLDPEISNLLWVQVSSEATSGPGCASTCSNVLKEKWKTLDIQNGSKNRIDNSTFFGIIAIMLWSRWILARGAFTLASTSLLPTSLRRHHCVNESTSRRHHRVYVSSIRGGNRCTKGKTMVIFSRTQLVGFWNLISEGLREGKKRTREKNVRER